MKTTLSCILGIVSSLLLTVGFVSAAEKFDVSAQHSTQYRIGMVKPAPDCTSPCGLIKPAPDCTSPCGFIKPAPDCTSPCGLV